MLWVKIIGRTVRKKEFQSRAGLRLPSPEMEHKQFFNTISLMVPPGETRPLVSTPMVDLIMRCSMSGSPIIIPGKGIVTPFINRKVPPSRCGIDANMQSPFPYVPDWVVERMWGCGLGRWK